jgi:hypothetical protein
MAVDSLFSLLHAKVAPKAETAAGGGVASAGVSRYDNRKNSFSMSCQYVEVFDDALHDLLLHSTAASAIANAAAAPTPIAGAGADSKYNDSKSAAKPGAGAGAGAVTGGTATKLTIEYGAEGVYVSGLTRKPIAQAEQVRPRQRWRCTVTAPFHSADSFSAALCVCYLCVCCVCAVCCVVSVTQCLRTRAPTARLCAVHTARSTRCAANLCGSISSSGSPRTSLRYGRACGSSHCPPLSVCPLTSHSSERRRAVGSQRRSSARPISFARYQQRTKSYRHTTRKHTHNCTDRSARTRSRGVVLTVVRSVCAVS